MNKKFSGEDRRKFKRVKIRFSLTVVYREDEPLEVRLRDGSKEYIATMLDISEGGMSISTDVNIPVSTVLWIIFTLSNIEEERVDFFGAMELKGEVKNNTELKHGVYRLGICFLDIDEKYRENISSFVELVEAQTKKEEKS